MNTATVEVKRGPGRPKAAATRTIVAARVLPETKQRFDERAKQQGSDMSSIIEGLIEAYLQQGNEAH